MQNFEAVEQDVKPLSCTIKPWSWLLFSSNVMLGDLLCRVLPVSYTSYM